jgi:CelD/BcsL family acetyltransferase involved in cellulose biosynthesis
MWTPSALVAFDNLRQGPEWRRWSELAANAPPYLAPGFFALVRPFVANGTPLVAEAWTSERMLGVLPLVLDGDRLRALRTDRSPGYDYCGDLDGIGAIWASLRDDERWNELVLDRVPASSPLVTHLPDLARRDGCPITIKPDSRQPYFALDGFEQALSSKLRTNLERNAKKAGELTFERIVEPSDTDLAEARRMERMAHGLAHSPGSADDLATQIDEKLARMPGAVQYFLRIRGVRVAMLFALEDRHTVFALRTGYDPTYAKLGPGHLMIWKVAKDAEQRGLAELRFAHEDDTTRKWTDRGHEHFAIAVYRRSARGLVRHALHDMIEPRLPEPARTTPWSPLPRQCQREDFVGKHGIVQYVRGRIHRGLGLKSGLKRAIARKPPPVQGQPSCFPVGSWVRVIESPELDASGKLRGLQFVTEQWRTVGRVYRVGGHVRRLLDDRGRFRTVHRTVLLEGVHCDGDGHSIGGCGRHCPLMYRDEWLEPAEAPAAASPPLLQPRYARVRPTDEIYATLDLRGRRDGLTFMPEMAAYAGKRLAITERIDRLYELDHHVPPRAPIYLLAGSHCTGAVLGAKGPCDRACAILWHEDWLILEDS